MTNTKFRKRALLSSVAMLLVALVALGSATFAWFVQKPDAKADGLTAKTSTSSSLLVQTETDALLGSNAKGFTHEALLNAASSTTHKDSVNLQPASWTGTGGSFAKVGAANADSYLGTGAIEEASVGLAGDVYRERIYFKASNGDSTTSETVYLKKVNWTNGTGSMADDVFVLITKSDNTVIGLWGNSSAAMTYLNAQTGTYGSTTVADRTAANVKAKSNSAFTGIECGNAKFADRTSLTISSGAVSDTDFDYVNVYVFLNGEGSDVASDNVKGANLQDLITALDIEFSYNA